MEITSYLLGKKAGGGGSTPVLQDKDVTITQNGETTIIADSGYDGLNSVDVTTNVPSQKFGFITGGRIMLNNLNGNLQSEINNLLANVDTSTITDMQSMFYNNDVLTLDLTGLNTSNATSMTTMFQNITSLTTLDLSGFNTTKVTTFSNMFAGCTSLQTLDISSFTSENVKYIQMMFNNCTSLTKIDMRNMDFASITNYTNMFGTSASIGPANNCLIIVKDATQKQWIRTNFSRMTNVKTVAEYEG